MARRQAGFTIVELLIVIVVIAILATISVVAYSGIQNRANDSAVQSDLSNLAKKIQLAAADTGEFPAGGATKPSEDVTSTGNSAAFPGFTFAPSKEAYMPTVSNLYYCMGVEDSSGQKIFRVAARSASGNTFIYSSNSQLQNLGNVALGAREDVCQGMDYPYTWSYGYNPGSGYGWFSWTNG